MKAFFALTLLALVAAASARGTPKNVVTDIIEDIVEKHRGDLANLAIPLIDLGEFGNVTNLLIVGAENFVIEVLEANGPLSVDIKNATISLATASATANIASNNVNLVEIGVIINGEGDLTGTATDMWLTVSLDISLNGLKISVKDFSNLDIRVGGIQAELTGIDNQDDVNNKLSTLLAPFLTSSLAGIANENKQVILDAINEILAGLTY